MKWRMGLEGRNELVGIVELVGRFELEIDSG